MNASSSRSQNTLRQIRGTIKPELLAWLPTTDPLYVQKNVEYSNLQFLALSLGELNPTKKIQDERIAWAFFDAKLSRPGAAPKMHVWIQHQDNSWDRTDMSLETASNFKQLALRSEFLPCRTVRDINAMAKYYMLLLAEEEWEGFTVSNIPYNASFAEDLKRMCARYREWKSNIPSSDASVRNPKPPTPISPESASALSSALSSADLSESPSIVDGAHIDHTMTDDYDNAETSKLPARTRSSARSSRHPIICSSSSSSETPSPPGNQNLSELQKRRENLMQVIEKHRSGLSDIRASRAKVREKIRGLERRKKHTEKDKRRLLQYRRLEDMLASRINTAKRCIDGFEAQRERTDVGFRWD